MSNPTATVGEERTFDPHAQLPPILQSRLDTWVETPPKSQFQQYGPLNAYLQGHKFLSDTFLVKPQALLRCLANNTQVMAHEKRKQNPEKAKSKSKREKKKPRYSTDSHGELVTSQRLYPDFDIDQCYSFDGDIKLTCDVIRVVVEVGSVLEGTLSAAQDEVERNLKLYLRIVGNRAHGRLLGIGIVANTVCLLKIEHKPGWMQRNFELTVRDVEWISLFNKRFPEALDEMIQFCKDDQPFDNWDEEGLRSFTRLSRQQDNMDTEDVDMA